MTRLTKGSASGRARLDPADEFIWTALRAFAAGTSCGPPPLDGSWMSRASASGVLPVVLHTMQSSGSYIAELRGKVSAAVVAREMRTMADLRLVAQVLDGNSLPWAALKGPVLSEVVFAQRHVRDYADLDLLVRPSDMKRAVERLVEAGGSLYPTDWAAVTKARTAELSILLPFGTMLDLHWSIFNLGRVRKGFNVTTEELIDRRTEREIGGLTVHTLDDLDLVLHTLTHACLSGCTTLRWLLDAQQCIRWLSASPSDLEQRAMELGLQNPARTVLDCAAHHLDGSLAAWADAVGPNTAWTKLLRAVSVRRPPSAPSVTSRSSESFYAATRETTVRSFGALAYTAADKVRHARGGWPELRPESVSLKDPGYHRWLRVAADESQPGW